MKRRRLGALVAVWIAAVLVIPPAGAQPEQPTEAPAALSLELLRLDAVLGSDDELAARLLVRNDGRTDRADVRILATVHRETIGRWELQQALEDGELGNIIHPFVVDVPAIPAGGSRTVDLTQTTAEIGLARADLAGVYPLRFQLLVEGEVLDEIVTSMVVVDAPVDEPLSVALALPLGLPPARDAEGVVVDRALLDAIGEGGLLRRTLDALNDARRLGVSIGLDGHTLTDLADLADGFALREEGVVTIHPADSPHAQAARDTLDAISRLARRRLVEPLALPYASADLVAMMRSGARGEVARLLVDGAPAIHELTGVRPTTDILWPPDGVDSDTLQLALEVGTESVLLSESQLSAGVTGVQSPLPIRRVREGAELVTAFVPDPYIEAYLRRGSDGPVLAAQRILAEVASVYFEVPAMPERGMLIAPPPGMAFPGELVDALGERLSRAPFVRSVTLSRLPDLVASEPALVRLGYPEEARQRELPPAYTAQQANARRALGSLAGVLEQPDGLPTRFDALLLQATSTAYRGDRQPAGRSLMRAVSSTVSRLYSSVRVLDSPPVTLTSVEGQLPVTVRSTADVPLRVLITLRTSRYEVDGGPTREVVLEPDSTQILTFGLRAVTPGGTSPIQVVVSDMEGIIDLATGTVVVRSTAFSGVAVAITAGGAVFLLLWWAREARRRRRAGLRPSPAAGPARGEASTPHEPVRARGEPEV